MKKIVRLTESDLARIVKRVINERQYLMEGVPDTTLVANGAIEFPARTICGGIDYIRASVELSNTGVDDAYILSRPSLRIGNGQDASLNGQIVTVDFNVTINGKPSIGSPEDQKQFKIPKGKKAILNIVIATRVASIEGTFKSEWTNASKEPSRSQREKLEAIAKSNRTLAYNKLKNLKSVVLNLKYNGQPIQIPVNFGGFTVDSTRTCDAPIQLPKGF